MPGKQHIHSLSSSSFAFSFVFASALALCCSVCAFLFGSEHIMQLSAVRIARVRQMSKGGAFEHLNADETAHQRIANVAHSLLGHVLRSLVQLTFIRPMIGGAVRLKGANALPN